MKEKMVLFQHSFCRNAKFFAVTFLLIILPFLDKAFALSPGDLDISFSLDGMVTTNIISDGNGVASAVAIQPDGKIVVAGDTYDGIVAKVAVVRYNSDGSLDTSFNTSGKTTAYIGMGSAYISAVVIQPDGKILVAGYTRIDFGDAEFVLVRYHPNGALDSTFGIGGKVVTDIGGREDRLAKIAVQSDGKILAVGMTDVGPNANAASNGDIALLRYNANGILDATFDTDGISITPIGSGYESANDLALQSDGKIVVAGETENDTNKTDFFTARFNTNGSMDTIYGTNGKTVTDFAANEDGANSLVIQSDGKIVAGGYSADTTNINFALVRYNTNGIVDNTFGNAGKVVTPAGTTVSYVNDITINNSGMIFVAGDSDNANDSDFTVASYLSTGTLNSAFGSGGIVKTQISTGNDFARAIAIQSDNKIVVAGSSFNGTTDDFAVARYLFTSPTAASVTIGGRVVNSPRIGIGGAVVTIANSNGTLNKTAITNSFGYYRFEDITVGETYIITVRHKRYSFTPQVLNVFENCEDVNFTGAP